MGNSCSTTVTSIVTSTTTPIFTATYYAATAERFNGDDYYGIPTPSVISSTDTIIKSIDSTTTVTSRFTPADLLGLRETEYHELPSGFIPVQTSLPNATYAGNVTDDNPNRRKVRRDDACTVTSTSTITAPTSTTTVTDYKSETLVLFPQEGVTIALPYTQSGPITTTALQTTTETDYAGTVTTTTTLTKPDITVTQYVACATNNYADHVQVGDSYLQAEYIKIVNDDYPTISRADDPYDCCEQAFDTGAGAWLWANEANIGQCALYYPNGTTAQSDQTYEVELTGSLDYEVVVGNGQYGEITSGHDLGY